jgi:release factor glutamine methyltransferase
VGRLVAAGCVAAEAEAAELVAVTADPVALDVLVRRREDGEPLAWITGTTRFGGRTVRVHPGVYVPRPQTEELARRAAEVLGPGGVAIDLCSGSGAIAAHLLAVEPTATVVGVDRDERAAANACANGVAALVGDVSDRLPLPDRVADVVTAVAPYVPTPELAFLPTDVQRHEPRFALDGGGDGLDLVRDVVRAAARLLRPGGWLFTEVGGAQDEALGPALAGAGFDVVVPWHDEDDDLRGLAARRGAEVLP